MSRERPTALGGDIFAGLFTHGVKQAGFNVLGHLEHTTYGSATARLNFPQLPIYNGIEIWAPERFRRKVDFMYCNPPCAAWSNMRRTTSHWTEHVERLTYVRELARAGMIISPQVWCWESVVNAYRAGQEFVFEIARLWNDQNYHVTIWLQNNMHLGGMQSRERMLLIAHRHPLIWPRLTTHSTVVEALGSKSLDFTAPSQIEMAPLTKWWSRLWKESVKYNGYMRRTHFELIDSVTPRDGKINVPLATVKRLTIDKPAPVMLQCYMRLHHSEPRFYNWREWLQLCNLPQTWKTAIKQADPASRELARSVMPPVGKFLGTAVRRGLELPAFHGKYVETRLFDMRKPQAIIDTQLWTQPRVPRPEPPAWRFDAPLITKPERARHTSNQAPTTTRQLGSGRRIRELLEDGCTTNEILVVIRKEFPASKATSADVSWNRRKLRQLKGEL